MKIRSQQSKHVLGSEAFITIVDEISTDEMFKILWNKIDSFEKRFSRFDINSELSFVNINAGKPIKISSEFLKLIKTSIKYSLLTNGLFNPFILPTLQKVGYKTSWPSPDDKTFNLLDMSNKKQCEIKDIKIDGLNLTIPKDSALDFGGIGKGYLIDQLSSILIKHSYRDFWISLGGDIVCSGFDLDNKRWKINIANANHNDENATSIFSKEDGSILAIATSGITKRKGEGWHHIIDPRINQSANTDLLTATILADSATKADVYAKNIIIVGSQESLALAKKNNLKIWLQKNNNKCIEYLQYNWSPND